MYIMELDVSGNPALQVTDLNLNKNRLVLVHLLPRVWVLNGIFVTLQERAAALEMFTHADTALLTATRWEIFDELCIEGQSQRCLSAQRLGFFQSASSPMEPF